jgi:hypothetical protein
MAPRQCICLLCYSFRLDEPALPEVNIGEKGTPERNKPKRRRRKMKMQQRSPSAVSDDNAVDVDKSRADSKDVPGDD